jgi:hypothetical protein
MNAPEPSRRRWFDLRAIAIFASAVAIVACLIAWKWAESHDRDELLAALNGKGAVLVLQRETDSWSTDWPFRNVERIKSLLLFDGRFNHEDVRRLRRAFPGVATYHAEDQDGYVEFDSNALVKLPED